MGHSVSICHQYAHNQHKTTSLMPYAPKGVDAAIFSVFRSLGLTVKVRPVLNNSDFTEIEEFYYEQEMETMKGDEPYRSYRRWQRKRLWDDSVLKSTKDLPSWHGKSQEAISPELEMVFILSH